MPDLPSSLVWLIAGAIAAAIVMRLLIGSLGAFPYYRHDQLMSPAELALFRALRAAVRGRAEVFTKVRIADLVGVHNRGTRKARIVALNRIAAKHVDFVLTDARSMRVLCAVELDDKSHAQRDRQQRDRFVDRTFEKAGLPLLRVRAQGRYDVQVLREALAPVLGDAPTGVSRAA